MKYKVGDKVRVKSLEWYNENKNSYHCIKFYPDVWFRVHMSEYCGKIVTISNIYFSNHNITTYNIVEDDGTYIWTDDMFEGLVKEETIQPVVFENIVFPNENYADKVELCLGNDYEIVIEDGRTFVQRKKPKYPTTYEECCKVLGSDPSKIMVISNRKDIIHEENKHCYETYNLYQLLICRDAYWKVADNWKPDWNDDVDYVYTIKYNGTHIRLYNYTQEYAILAFPTKEMRDAFYDNFNNLIEKCKELL